MTIKYVTKVENSTKTLRKLKIGDAFKLEGSTYGKVGKDADDGESQLAAGRSAGEDIGYLLHFRKDSEVELVNPTISED